jgi:hypothetical protein
VGLKPEINKASECIEEMAVNWLGYSSGQVPRVDSKGIKSANISSQPTSVTYQVLHDNTGYYSIYPYKLGPTINSCAVKLVLFYLLCVASIILNMFHQLRLPKSNSFVNLFYVIT